MPTDPEALAEQLIDSLRSVADKTEHAQVSRLQITLGSLYGVSAAALAEALEDRFDDPAIPGRLDGAAVEVVVVEPGQRFRAPRRAEEQQATGWEILVTDVRGPAGGVH